MEKEQKVSQALENGKSERSEASYQRNQLALDALQILAFDGDDAKKWQTWLRERLQAQLTSCDVCIRSYHYGKRQMKQKLEEYDCPWVSKLVVTDATKGFLMRMKLLIFLELLTISTSTGSRKAWTAPQKICLTHRLLSAALHP